MKVFILDKTRLSKFTLIEKNEEVFVFSYKPVGMKKECLITFERIDNEWYLKSNGIVDIIVSMFWSVGLIHRIKPVLAPSAA